MNRKIRNMSVILLSMGLLLASFPTPVMATTDLSLDLWWMPVERPYFPDAKSVAEIMQADLGEIGVETTLISYEWGEYLDRTEDGEHDMCLLGWSADIGDPDNFMYVLLSGDSAVVGTAMNVAFYNDSEVTALLGEAQATFDQATREPLYEEACSLIHQDSPWVTVAHSQNLAGVYTGVTDFHTHPTGPGANVYKGVTSPDDDLIIGVGTDPVSLDPAEWTDGQSWKVGRQVYDGLYNMPVDDIEPEPGLATSYTTSADGLNWTFNLRQGVTFHDGSEFNASSVVFSFERAMNWADNTSTYYINGWTPPEAGYYDYIYGGVGLEVVEVSEFVVQFNLDLVYAPFLASLSMGVFAIVSPTYVMAHNGTQTTDRLGLNPVGTGPYEFTEWVADASVTLDVYDDYWGTAPVTDTLIFKAITEAATRVNELKAGTVHIVDNVAASDAGTIEDEADTSLTAQAGMNVGYLAMNALRPPFDNDTLVDDPDFGGQTTHAALVRRAIHYAIDRSTIIDEVYDGRAIQAKNPLPPSFWGFNDTVEDYDYDPAHAREILSSLGYTVKAARGTGLDAVTSLIVTVGGMLALMVIFDRKRKN